MGFFSPPQYLDFTTGKTGVPLYCQFQFPGLIHAHNTHMLASECADLHIGSLDFSYFASYMYFLCTKDTIETKNNVTNLALC